MEARGKGKR